MSARNPNLNVKSTISGAAPQIHLSKIGIVSRDYRIVEKDARNDFSGRFEDVISCLDKNGCDSALFSSYTIDVKGPADIVKILGNMSLDHIRVVFVEEFFWSEEGGRDSCENPYVIYYEEMGEWKEHRIGQVFGSLSDKKIRSKIRSFKAQVGNHRQFGNFTILLCGESNIVKYSRKEKCIKDIHEYTGLLGDNIRIILNPIHDLMTRHEMKKKRRFLSNGKRLVISVWNKGKEFGERKTTKDGGGNCPPWSVCLDGQEQTVPSIEHEIDNKSGIVIGVVDLKEFF